MSVTHAAGRPRRRVRERLRRVLVETGSAMLGIGLLIWSLVPVYNMLLIALDRDEGDIEFEGILWPPDPSLHSFAAVLTQGYWLVEDFWHPVRQQLLHRRADDALDRGDRVARELRPGAHAGEQGLAAGQRAVLTYVVPASSWSSVQSIDGQ